jgi:hypothetical protein
MKNINIEPIITHITLSKEEKKIYDTICELTWGCSPIDIVWASNSNIYKDMKTKLQL